MATRVDAGVIHVVSTRAALDLLSAPIETEAIDVEIPPWFCEELRSLQPALKLQDIVSTLVEELDARFTASSIVRHFATRSRTLPELDVLPLSLAISRSADDVFGKFSWSAATAGIFVAYALRLVRESVRRELGSPREARRLRVRGATPAQRQQWTDDQMSTVLDGEMAWYATLFSSVPAVPYGSSHSVAPALVSEYISQILAGMPGDGYGVVDSLRRQVIVPPRAIVRRAEHVFEDISLPAPRFRYAEVNVPTDERMDAVAELLAIPAPFVRGAALEELIMRAQDYYDRRVEAPN